MNMYFVSKFYRGVKLFFAGLGTTGGIITIVYGALQSGGTVFVVGGSIVLANSLFNFWETSKVSADILKQVNNLNGKIDDFSDQNKQQQMNIKELNKFKTDFGIKNRALQKTVNDVTHQLSELDQLRLKSQNIQVMLEKNLILEKDQVIILSDQNVELRTNLIKMDELRMDLKTENSNYQDLLAIARRQLGEIEDLMQSLEHERNELNKSNLMQNEQIIKQIDIIKESKSLIMSLSRFGDQYQEFSQTIGENLVKFEQTGTNLASTEDDLEVTAQIMKNLVNELKHRKFSDLDLNSDQIVTQQEFTSALEKL